MSLRRPLSIALLAGAVALLFFVFSPDRLLLFPSRDPLSSVGATRRTIPFGAGALEVWTGASARRPGVCLLRFYGNADRADANVGQEAAAWKAAPPAEIWGVNYPGYGGSSGAAHLRDIGPAAVAAFDALKVEAAGRPILVFGTSLGSVAALHVAARRPVAGVILQNPPPLRQIVLRQYGWWNLWLLAGPVALRIPSDLDSIGNARAVRVRGVFLLAGDDEVVRPRYQRLVVDAYGGEKRVIPLAGALHNDPLAPEASGQLNAAIPWLLGAP